jgi:hypothetical protein
MFNSGATMRYFLPQFRIAALSGAQVKLRSKIGGLPWGLPAGRWPRCCGRAQKLLAQLCHEPPMLDLGGTGRVLHLFQCMDCCSIDGNGAAFVLDRAELGDGLTEIAGIYDMSEYEYGYGLIGEAWIDGWTEKDDGIPASRLGEFFDEPQLWSLQEEFKQIDWFDQEEATRFGGSPRWTGNGPMTYPGPPFEPLLQLSTWIRTAPTAEQIRALSRPIEEIEADVLAGKLPPSLPWNFHHEPATNSYGIEYTNLASDGVAFVSIDRTARPPGAKWALCR